MKKEEIISKKIFIVDDDPYLVDILTIRLKKTGYNVISTNVGLETLDIVAKEKPDLVILDLMLSHLDGYHICKMLKFDDRYERIPIIMLTAKADKKSMEIGLEAGADKYITKPFDMDLLMKDIEELLEIKREY